MKDLADLFTESFPLEQRLFLVKNRHYLNPMKKYPEVDKKVFALVNAGYFITAKIHDIKLARTNSKWRTLSTIKYLQRQIRFWPTSNLTDNEREVKELFDRKINDVKNGYDVWTGVNQKCLVGWIEYENSVKLRKKINRDFRFESRKG